jgi:hypothetical protein
MHHRKLTTAACVALSLAALTLCALATAALANPPDTRVYELVSPAEKGGNDIAPSMAIAAPSGEQVIVSGGVANATLANGMSWMLEKRTATGWSGVPIGTPPGQADAREQVLTSLDGVNEDFSRFVWETQISLDPRDQAGFNVYLGDGPNEPFTWASAPPAPVVKESTPVHECVGVKRQCTAFYAGASRDLSHVVWSQLYPLVEPPAALPGSPPDTHESGDEVYESVEGVEQQLVGLVPSQGAECGPGKGECVVPRCGATMGAGHFYPWFGAIQGAVSGDGSQVVFISPDPITGCAPGELYVREGGASTLEISASQKTNGTGPGGADPHGLQEKVFVGSAEEDGQLTTVFFTSKEELTNDANTGSGDQGNDLYAYDMQTGGLTDLTPDSNPADAEGANVIGFIGAATDGSSIYFTAMGALAPGATPGQPNLYAYDAPSGRTTFIAPGSGVSVLPPGFHYQDQNLTAQVTPDGQQLVFLDSESLTSYRQEGAEEIYLYDEPSNRLTCVSCNPTGAPPAGGASFTIRAIGTNEGFNEGRYAEMSTLPETRVISEDGSRVFFDSPDQLTPEAPAPAPTRYPYGLHNIALGGEALEPNLYEYENGRIHLIAPAARLLTSSASGNDVFFDTYSQLVPQDRDGSPDVYDARVDGGFPALAPLACSGTSCQGPPAAAPIFATPASVTFAGVGNFPAAPATPEATVRKTVKTRRHEAKRGKKKRTGRAKRHAGHSKHGRHS